MTCPSEAIREYVSFNAQHFSASVDFIDGVTVIPFDAEENAEH